MAVSSAKERADSGAIASLVELQRKGEEDEGIRLEDFQAQVDRLKVELVEARAAKETTGDKAGTGTASGSTSVTDEKVELEEFQASVNKVKEELAEARAARRKDLEAIGRELGDENEGGLAPSEGSAVLAVLREELSVAQRALASRTEEVENMLKARAERKATHISQLRELEAGFSSRLDEVSAANEANLEKVKANVLEVINVSKESSGDTSTLRDRIKVLTEQCATALKSVSLKTTELAAEKASRVTLLKEVEGRLGIRVTHLEKELATARAANKKAESYKSRITTLESALETCTNKHAALGRVLGVKDIAFEALFASSVASEDEVKRLEEKLREVKVVAEAVMKEKDEATCVLRNQIAGISAELRSFQEGVKLLKVEYEEERRVWKSLGTAAADIPSPPPPPSISQPPSLPSPLHSHSALVQHSDFVLPQLLKMIDDLNLANTVLRTSNTSLLLRLVGIEV